MSSLRSTFSLDSNSTFDELKWVIQIKRTLLEVEDGDESFYPVAIFNVPKLLMASDPNSYIPQQVSIGPYHYWNQELYEMQRCKILAAKRFQKQLKCLKFDTIVDQLIKLLLEEKIRACYHKFLDFNGETLVWIIAVDASFLLEFLQIYAIKEEGTMKVPYYYYGEPSKNYIMPHFVDYGGKKSTHDAILRDIVMLENQIPLFVLRKMLEFKFSSSLVEDGDKMLVLMLIAFFKEISPFKMMIEEEYSNYVQVSSILECAHILGFLYHMIVPNLEQREHQKPEIIEDDTESQQEDQEENCKEGNEKSSVDPTNVKKFLSELWKILSKLNKGPVNLIKKVLFSRPFKFIVKLPWTIISNLPGVKVLKQPIEYFFFSSQDNEEEEENGNSSSISNDKPPLVEEITIPSVTQLLNCGVHFLPTNGSISSIKFDTRTCTLYLPTISLDVNSEVLLRNLVAYEASIAKGPLVITRYTELMNGIIDSEDDVKILRGKGVVMNHLKSDEEVANLWNGMNKSLRLTKVQFLDKVIEDINRYYNGTMKVKVWKFMKVYVSGSWQFLTFLATILLLLLMTLQAFCSVYTCSRIFGDTLTSD